ncbi:sigma factor-like helix-turn-helix DNA-binding protein [Marmoricola sp. URHA0025 HA25]
MPTPRTSPRRRWSRRTCRGRRSRRPVPPTPTSGGSSPMPSSAHDARCGWPASGWSRRRRSSSWPRRWPTTDWSCGHTSAPSPPRQRAVIVLRYYEDLSEQQIADALGCSTGTVKSTASDALKVLRSRMTPTEGGGS